VPTIQLDDGACSARVLAGTLARVQGPVTGVAVEPLLVEVRVDPGQRVLIPVPPEHTAFLYALDGVGQVGPRPGTPVGPSTLVLLGAGTHLEVAAPSTTPFRFLLTAGRPLGDPIVRGGPFAMNTQAEIEEAFADWRAGRIGRAQA
jgi:hypothetical protein